MPHTFAHPFFAAPLKRLMPQWLRVSGLALGSMAPDFEYFVAMEPYRTIGHTLPGFFLVDLPLCAAAALVMERLLLPTMPLLLPSMGGWDRFAAERLGMRPLAKAGDWLAFAVSAFIGFLTHLFMDAWTHGHAYFTDRFDWLHGPGIGRFVLYESLQFVFSAIGAGAIALYVLIRWRAWRRAAGSGAASPVHPPDDKRRFVMVAVGVAALAILAKWLIDPPFSLFGMANVAPFTAIAAGWMIAALSRRSRKAAWAALVMLLAVMSLYACAKAYLPPILRGAGYRRLAEPALTVLWVAALWGFSLIAAGCAAARPRNPRNTYRHDVRSV